MDEHLERLTEIIDLYLEVHAEYSICGECPKISSSDFAENLLETLEEIFIAKKGE